ncbi:MAG: hypothetical protein KC620_02535 [Myxococcales bacterium]|nr:hypothetical protein [Myxococcales bacterium]
MSQKLVSPKSIRRILILDAEHGSVTTLHKRKDKSKKKQSRLLRPFERGQRRLATAYSTASESYLDRHKRSNRKKRNGWIRDLAKNQRRSWRKGVKKLKLRVM